MVRWGGLLGGGALAFVYFSQGLLTQAGLPLEVDPVNTMLVTGIGALLGYAFGGVLWWALPVVLPATAAALTYAVLSQQFLGVPTLLSLCVIAAVLSLFVLRILRRI